MELELGIATDSGCTIATDALKLFPPQCPIKFSARRHSASSKSHHFSVFFILLMASSASAACAPDCGPAEGWDNFANNLGSDLAPLLALFGEQVTKQYLGESMGWIDSFLFALAPLGIITAIVAAIRVAGTPLYKSLIGRAKESSGDVESDLMSSTSSDVCELWSGESVVRVLGSPVLLQLVYVERQSTGDTAGPASAIGDMKPEEQGVTAVQKGLDSGSNTGIFTFLEACDRAIYKKEGQQPQSTENLQALGGDSRARQDVEGLRTRQNPPNLSLNVSIKPVARPVLILFVILGILLQGGVLAFAAVVQYHLKLPKNSSKPVPSGFPLFFCGTLSLVVGMFLCAHAVETSTQETTWVPNKDYDPIGSNRGPNEKPVHAVIWLQQGGQTVGDQRFGPFARVTRFSKTKPREQVITTSHKADKGVSRKFRVFLVTVAVPTALVGFIIQFAGFRVMHSSVLVVQLGVVLIMTALRSGTHIERESENEMKSPDHVEGHELDWLAKELCNCAEWEVVTGAPESEQLGEVNAPSPSTGLRVMQARARLAELSSDWKLKDRATVRILRNAIETTINQIPSTMTMDTDFKGATEFKWVLPVKTRLKDEDPSELEESSIESEGGFKVRHLFRWAAHCFPELKDKNERQREPAQHPIWHLSEFDLVLTREKVDGQNGDWKVSESELEAALCLWISTLTEDNRKRAEDRELRRGHFRLFGWATEEGRKDYDLWINRGTALAEESLSSGPLTLGRHFGRITSSNPSGRDECLYVKAEGDLELLCAQDLYSAFVHRLAARVEDVDGVTTRRIDGAASDGSPFRLYNSSLATLAKIYNRSGLGTVEEAYFFIVPAFRAAKKLPEVRKASSKLETKGLWDKATDIDSWLYEHPWTRVRDTVVVNAEIGNRLLKLTQKLTAGTAEGESNHKLRQMWNEAYSRCRKFEPPENPPANRLAYSTVNHLAQSLVNLSITCEKTKPRTDLDTVFRRASNAVKKLDPKKRHTAEIIENLIEFVIEKKLFDEAQALVEFLWAGMITQWQGRTMESDHPTMKLLTDACQKRGRAGIRDELLRYLSIRKSLRLAAEANLQTSDSTHTKGAHLLLDLDFTGKYRTPLQMAAAAGYTEVVRALLEKNKKVDINAAPAEYSGQTALQAAVAAGNIDIVKILLKANADINAAPAKYFGRTALQAAAGAGYFEITKVLLGGASESVAKVNAGPSPYSGRTALQAAAEAGHSKILDLLLKAEAKVNAQPATYSGRTALQAAAGAGRIKIVKLLVAKEAKVNAEPAAHSGRTALQAAAEAGYTEIVNILLNARANVNAEPSEYSGRTALQAAAGAGHAGIVNLLLDKDAEVNAAPTEYAGRTALQAAAEAGHTEIVRILVGKQADINAKPAKNSGRTALQAATGAGNIGMVNLLLDMDADVDAEPATDSGRTALQAAAEAGHTGIVELLLKKGANVNADPATYSGRTALQAAAGAGHAEIMDMLLAAGAELSGTGRTALQAAVEAGHTEIVELLLKAGADVNAEPATYSGRTALQAAAGAGHAEIMGMLLDRGANTNAEPAADSGRTALQAAAESGHTEIVELLLEEGTDVDTVPARYFGRTALQAAAEAGHTDIVKMLLNNVYKKADVNIGPAEHSGRTALQAAAEAGHTEIVKILLAAEASVNAEPAQYSGRTALQAAVEAGHTEIVKILLAAGANANAEPAEYAGRTALQAAVETGHSKIVKILLDSHADIDTQPKKGLTRTALQVAAGSGQEEILKQLLAAGADVEIGPMEYTGRTALQAAAEAGHIKIVKILLEESSVGSKPHKKANVNAAPGQYSGRTALQAAAEAGHIEIVKILLKAGADVNAKPAHSFGRTALQAAAENGRTDIVKILLAAEANINAEPAEYAGRTALQAAVEVGHTVIVKLLLDGKADVDKPITGVPLLSIAEKYGYQQIVQLLQPDDRISGTY